MNLFFSKKLILLCEKYSSFLIRASLAIVFIWFGLLKCLDQSPAKTLVMHAFPWQNSAMLVQLIGFWEVLIGCFVLFRKTLKIGLILFLLHAPGTFLPFFLSYNCCFVGSLWNLTLEGQYIIKNLVLISAVIFLIGSLKNQEE